MWQAGPSETDDGTSPASPRRLPGEFRLNSPLLTDTCCHQPPPTTHPQDTPPWPSLHTTLGIMHSMYVFQNPRQWRRHQSNCLHLPRAWSSAPRAVPRPWRGSGEGRRDKKKIFSPPIPKGPSLSFHICKSGVKTDLLKGADSVSRCPTQQLASY